MDAPRTLPLFPALSVPERTASAPASSPRTIPRVSSAGRVARPVPLRRPPGPEPQPRASVSQLWLAVRFSRLALDALKHGTLLSRVTGEGSLAVLDPEDRLQRVLACNDLARVRGVRAGQPLNAALAFDSTLITLPRDAFREQQLLERIAAQCHRFTPIVSIAGCERADAHELLLEVQGSLRLFGGARALGECVAGGLAGQGMEISLALTPTPQSALWLARGAAPPRSEEQQTPGEWLCIERLEDLAPHLARLSLACLRWPGETLERLANMGVRGIGDLVRLPRAGLARRIGQQWLDELDRAYGRRAEVRRRFEPGERYDDAQALDCEIETVAGLKAALAPLLTRLQRFLGVRGVMLDVLALELKHRAGAMTRVRLGLAAPSGDVAHLRGLLEERLASLALRAPVIAVRLCSGTLRTTQAVPARLPFAPFDRARVDSAYDGNAYDGARPSLDAAMPDALPRLVERLQARLGREAVFGVSHFAEHRPELAWRAVPVLRQEPEANCKDFPHRPLWLLAEPEPLRPSPRRWRIESGPERIESGWWDGGEVARDYFIACDPHGARCWIYRERRAPHRWFLHGLFG